GAEIVKQIRLRHAGGLGDAVDGRAAKAVLREHLQRRLEDQLAPFVLDAGPAFRRCGVHGALGFPFGRAGVSSGPMVWTSRPLACGAGEAPRSCASNLLTARLAMLTFVQSVKKCAARLRRTNQASTA